MTNREEEEEEKEKKNPTEWTASRLAGHTAPQTEDNKDRTDPALSPLFVRNVSPTVW